MKRMLKGFTLVEIMIVVAIIAILAAVAIPNFIKYRNESQKSSCISNMKQIGVAFTQYADDYKTYPWPNDTGRTLPGEPDGRYNTIWCLLTGTFWRKRR
jgi:prepilin-type N-terminal cleavage/methylation domain-containing protein